MISYQTEWCEMEIIPYILNQIYISEGSNRSVFASIIIR